MTPEQWVDDIILGLSLPMTDTGRTMKQIIANGVSCAIDDQLALCKKIAERIYVTNAERSKGGDAMNFLRYGSAGQAAFDIMQGIERLRQALTSPHPSTAVAESTQKAVS